jgi:hypothetical protein
VKERPDHGSEPPWIQEAGDRVVSYGTTTGIVDIATELGLDAA